MSQKKRLFNLLMQNYSQKALSKMPHRPEAPHFVRQVRSVFHFGYAFCTVLFIQIFAKVIFSVLIVTLQTSFVRVEWLVVEYERLWILQAKFLLVKTRGVCEVNTIAPHFVRQVRSVFHFCYVRNP